jgi:ubiquinone/menaquinone biosynthesis C-methylase UbiE
VSAHKSDKELAFLRDLYVSSDWGERFAELIDEHVVLPKKGRVLYVAAGTGGHALALLERAASAAVTLIGVDESEESAELARAKTAATKVRHQVEFHRGQIEALGFADDQFDLVIGDASLINAERLPQMLAEMVRVAAPGATIALTLASAGSFGEFFSIYWEALDKVHLEGHEHDVEALITELPTASTVEEMAAREGLASVESWTKLEEFDFASGEEFLRAPLVADFLLETWLAALPDERARASTVDEITRIIDDERSDMDFALSVKATLVVGRKEE